MPSPTSRAGAATLDLDHEADASASAPAAPACQLHRYDRTTTPKVTLPAYTTLDLPSTLAVAGGGTEASTRAHVDWAVNLDHLRALAYDTVFRNTTNAGHAGADCQPTWGTSVGYYLVEARQRDDGRHASFVSVNTENVAELPANDRIWIAKAVIHWRHDEGGGSSSISEIVVAPAHTIIAEAEREQADAIAAREHAAKRAYFQDTEHRADMIDDQEAAAWMGHLESDRRVHDIRNEAIERLCGLYHASTADLAAASREQWSHLPPAVCIEGHHEEHTLDRDQDKACWNTPAKTSPREAKMQACAQYLHQVLANHPDLSLPADLRHGLALLKTLAGDQPADPF